MQGRHTIRVVVNIDIGKGHVGYGLSIVLRDELQRWTHGIYESCFVTQKKDRFVPEGTLQGSLSKQKTGDNE